MDYAIKKASEIFEAGAPKGANYSKLHVFVNDMYDIHVWEDGVLQYEL